MTFALAGEGREDDADVWAQFNDEVIAGAKGTPWTPWDDIVSSLWETAHCGERSTLTSYQIITRDGEYIVVLDSQLSHWRSTPLDTLPIVGNDGVATVNPLDGAWPSTSFLDGTHMCDVCYILRQDTSPS